MLEHEQLRYTKKDAEGVAEIKNGNLDHWASLIEQHFPRLVRIAERYAGIDAQQKAIDSLHKLWLIKGRLEENLGVLALLYTIHRRGIIDEVRSNNELKYTIGNEPIVYEEETSVSIPEERIAENLDLKSALEKIPAAQRHAIESIYFADQSYAEMAAVSGESEGTWKSRVRIGLEKLKIIFDATNQE